MNLDTISSEKLGERISALRITAGLGRGDVISALQLNHDLVESWELGNSKPTEADLNRLAKLCRCDVADYFIVDSPQYSSTVEALAACRKGEITPGQLAVFTAVKRQDVDRFVSSAGETMTCPRCHSSQVDTSYKVYMRCLECQLMISYTNMLSFDSAYGTYEDWAGSQEGVLQKAVNDAVAENSATGSLPDQIIRVDRRGDELFLTDYTRSRRDRINLDNVPPELIVSDMLGIPVEADPVNLPPQDEPTIISEESDPILPIDDSRVID